MTASARRAPTLNTGGRGHVGEGCGTFRLAAAGSAASCTLGTSTARSPAAALLYASCPVPHRLNSCCPPSLSTRQRVVQRGCGYVSGVWFRHIPAGREVQAVSPLGRVGLGLVEVFCVCMCACVSACVRWGVAHLPVVSPGRTAAAARASEHLQRCAVQVFLEPRRVMRPAPWPFRDPASPWCMRQRPTRPSRARSPATHARAPASCPSCLPILQLP